MSKAAVCLDIMTSFSTCRLSVPLEACLNLCANLGSILKAYPAELKALAAMLRLRLFEALTLLPPTLLEGSYTQLLRLLVSRHHSSILFHKQKKGVITKKMWF